MDLGIFNGLNKADYFINAALKTYIFNTILSLDHYECLFICFYRLICACAYNMAANLFE